MSFLLLASPRFDGVAHREEPVLAASRHERQPDWAGLPLSAQDQIYWPEMPVLGLKGGLLETLLGVRVQLTILCFEPWNAKKKNIDLSRVKKRYFFAIKKRHVYP
jgi:hypothetical protein